MCVCDIGFWVLVAESRLKVDDTNIFLVPSAEKNEALGPMICAGFLAAKSPTKTVVKHLLAAQHLAWRRPAIRVQDQLESETSSVGAACLATT